MKQDDKLFWIKLAFILFCSDIFALGLPNNALHHNPMEIKSFIGVCRYPLCNNWKNPKTVSPHSSHISQKSGLV